MIEIGKEYVYLGKFVTVIEIHNEHIIIETRFGERVTCSINDIDEKPLK